MPRLSFNPRLNLTLGEKGSRVRANRIKALVGGGVLVVASMFAGLMVGSASNADQISAEAQVASQASAQVDRLTDHELAGQRVIATFNGTVVPRDIKRAIRRGRLGGVALFAGNVPTRAAARSVTRRLQKIKRPSGLRKYPLPIMIDQEGGQVKRLSGAPAASAKMMGRRGPGFSRTQGKRTGKNLKNAGVNIDLAPVLDVARPGGEIAETDRGFGRTARRVSATAVPFAMGLQAKNVAATGKHFPGLGMVSLNTDDAVQTVKSSKRVLRKVDEAPYRPFIRADGQLVMVGTAIYTAFGSKPLAEPSWVRRGGSHRRARNRRRPGLWRLKEGRDRGCQGGHGPSPLHADQGIVQGGRGPREAAPQRRTESLGVRGFGPASSHDASRFPRLSFEWIQRPVQFGLRFSAKARMPSLKSSEWKQDSRNSTSSFS